MAKDPAFLFYYKDWLVSTRFMNPEDKGFYIDLLCHQADMGSIPEDIINSIVPAKNWQNLCKKFTKDRQGFYNKTLREHCEKRRKFTESRRLNRLGKTKDKNNTSNSLDKLVVNATVNANADGNHNAKASEDQIAKELLDELKIPEDDVFF